MSSQSATGWNRSFGRHGSIGGFGPDAPTHSGPTNVSYTPSVTLGIPDWYEFMQPELVTLLEARLPRYVD